jgi:hypothetical protein
MALSPTDVAPLPSAPNYALQVRSKDGSLSEIPADYLAQLSQIADTMTVNGLEVVSYRVIR